MFTQCDNCRLKLVDLHGGKEGFSLVYCDLQRFGIQLIDNRNRCNYGVQIVTFKLQVNISCNYLTFFLRFLDKFLFFKLTLICYITMDIGSNMLYSERIKTIVDLPCSYLDKIKYITKCTRKGIPKPSWLRKIVISTDTLFFTLSVNLRLKLEVSRSYAKHLNLGQIGVSDRLYLMK